MYVYILGNTKQFGGRCANACGCARERVWGGRADDGAVQLNAVGSLPPFKGAYLPVGQVVQSVQPVSSVNEQSDVWNCRSEQAKRRFGFNCSSSRRKNSDFDNYFD